MPSRKKGKIIKRRRIHKRKFFKVVSLFVIGLVSFNFCIQRFITKNERSKIDEVIMNSSIDYDLDSDNSAELKTVKYIPKRKIVIDASNGGTDKGNTGVNGVLAKDINLSIALKVKNILKRYDDVSVVLTRSKDVNMSTSERIEIVNKSDADFLISIRQNAERHGKASGIETYVLSSESSEDNSNLNSNINGKTLAKNVQRSMIMYSDARDRGVLSVSNVDVLKGIKIPGIVVNTGFITHNEEGAKLSDLKYQERIAEGIAQGALYFIDNTLNKEQIKK